MRMEPAKVGTKKIAKSPGQCAYGGLQVKKRRMRQRPATDTAVRATPSARMQDQLFSPCFRLFSCGVRAVLHLRLRLLCPDRRASWVKVFEIPIP